MLGLHCALISMVLMVALQSEGAVVQSTEAVRPNPTERSHPPAADLHAARIAGIPGLICLPAHLAPSTPIVLMYHGFGPPASPEALAQAVPPIPNAISFYPWLPLFGPRMSPDGANDLVQRQADDYIARLLFPVMLKAAAELPKLVNEMSASFHLSSRRPVIVFGFSAGGAAALLSLTESDLHPAGIIVLNAPLSITQAVDGFERQIGHPYAWTRAARQAAVRYDVAAHAPQIARRHVGTAFLFLQSEQDTGYRPEPAALLADRLKEAASKYASKQDIEAVVIPDAGHTVLDPGRSMDPKGQAAESLARRWIFDWISQHALHREAESHHG
jgi:predicted esterase